MLFANSASSPTVYELFEKRTIATPYTNPAYAGPPGLCPRNTYHRIDQPDRRNVVSTTIVIMTASHRRNPTRSYKSTVWENDTDTTQTKTIKPNMIDAKRMLTAPVIDRNTALVPLPAV